jgi:hypothetical protein
MVITNSTPPGRFYLETQHYPTGQTNLPDQYGALWDELVSIHFPTPYLLVFFLSGTNQGATVTFKPPTTGNFAGGLVQNVHQAGEPQLLNHAQTGHPSSSSFVTWCPIQDYMTVAKQEGIQLQCDPCPVFTDMTPGGLPAGPIEVFPGTTPFGWPSLDAELNDPNFNLHAHVPAITTGIDWCNEPQVFSSQAAAQEAIAQQQMPGGQLYQLFDISYVCCCINFDFNGQTFCTTTHIFTGVNIINLNVTNVTSSSYQFAFIFGFSSIPKAGWDFEANFPLPPQDSTGVQKFPSASANLYFRAPDKAAPEPISKITKILGKGANQVKYVEAIYTPSNPQGGFVQQAPKAGDGPNQVAGAVAPAKRTSAIFRVLPAPPITIANPTPIPSMEVL